MTTNYLANIFLGRKLTEEQLRDITSPRAEIHIHVLYKCLQAGCVFGGLAGFVVGSWAILVKRQSFRTILNYTGKVQDCVHYTYLRKENLSDKIKLYFYIVGQ